MGEMNRIDINQHDVELIFGDTIMERKNLIPNIGDTTEGPHNKIKELVKCIALCL